MAEIKEMASKALEQQTEKNNSDENFEEFTPKTAEDTKTEEVKKS